MARPSAQKVAADDPSLLPSDDEDDDFVLSDAASEDSSSDSEDEDGNKRGKKKAKAEEAPKEPVMTKEAVDDLWASFNDMDDDPYAQAKPAGPAPVASTSKTSATTTSKASSLPKPVERKKITIQVEYQFVGETVVQDKEVWSDSAEAIAFLAKQPSSSSSTSTPTPLPIASTSSTVPPSTSNATSIEALFGDATDSPSTSTSTPAAVPETKSTPTPPPAVAPPRKRKAGGLDAMAAGLGIKPQKLNTLEKSKLDWNKYVTTNSLTDDLTKARKDGYLEKQDFLQRTEDRKDADYDKFKSGNRAKKF